MNSVIWYNYSVIFAIVLSHFMICQLFCANVISVILLVWTQSLCQSFCYSELSHFAMMNSAIFLLQWTQPVYYNAQLFYDFVTILEIMFVILL
jgi:hypothetical protein